MNPDPEVGTDQAGLKPPTIRWVVMSEPAEIETVLCGMLSFFLEHQA